MMSAEAVLDRLCVSIRPAPVQFVMRGGRSLCI